MTKDKLLAAIADKNRGIVTTATDRAAILATISELESDNPHPRPLTTAIDLLAGNWRLLYTSSQSLLGIDRFPLTRLGDIYQCIRPQTNSLYNFAEVESFIPGLNGVVAIVASFTPASEARVNVRFNRSLIGFQKLMDYTAPDRAISDIERGRKFTAIDFPINTQNREPAWLEVTYLDDNLRIGRGNEGNVFVLTKT